MRLRRVLSPLEASTMTGLPRFTRNPLRIITLTSVLAVPGVLSTPIWAQEQAAAQPAPGAAATTAPSAELKDAVENLWYYGKVAKYDLAAAEGQKILDSGAPPESVLIAFEEVSRSRNDEMDVALNRWHALE